MVAPGTFLRANGHDVRRRIGAAPRMRVTAYGLALRVLGALFVAWMAVLLPASTAFAHTRGEAQYERLVERSPQLGSFARTTAECTSEIVISNAAISAWSAEFRATPPGDESDNVDRDDCCGVACHAAVYVAPRDTLRRVTPLRKGTPGGPPALVGRSQGPPERPPWISLRLSSRQDAAG
jgi:hypothetical protein